MKTFGMKVHTAAWLIVVLPLMIGYARASSPTQSINAYQELNRSFPGSLHIRMNNLQRTLTLEFCPDNTCDGFVVSHQVSESELVELAYIFIFYFSDYYVLADWRTREGPQQIAKSILAKPRYERCRVAPDIETARCILRRLDEQGRLKLYAVRYDEKARHADRIRVPKATLIK